MICHLLFPKWILRMYESLNRIPLAQNRWGNSCLAKQLLAPQDGRCSRDSLSSCIRVVTPSEALGLKPAPVILCVGPTDFGYVS